MGQQAGTNWGYLYIFMQVHSAEKRKKIILISYYPQDNKIKVATTWEHLHCYAEIHIFVERWHALQEKYFLDLWK